MNHMSMKSQPRYRLDTCEECRALRTFIDKPTLCLLGHPIDQETLSPTEPCPKPISYVALREALSDD